MPNGMNEKQVRDIVMGLMSKELEPLLHWMHGFWSNGSNGPLGYYQMRNKAEDEKFQTRVKQDDERYKRLELETKGQSETLDILKMFMQEQRLFREMREKAEEKADKEKREADEKREKRRARNWAFAKWAAGIIGPILLGFMAWAYSAAAPIIKIIWEDYLRAHPLTMEQLKHRASDDDSSQSTEQHVTIPPIREVKP